MTRGRAGLLACSCDFDPPDDRPARAASVGFVACGFAFSVLSQALAFAALPIAGATLAPTQEAAAFPVAALLVGAAAATFPASFLTGLFGRRSSFALGASLGVAGAAIAAWSLYSASFPALCLGAFWLGAAQGFGLFYRHTVGARPRAAALVLGAGGLAAFAAPGVADLSREALGPLAPAGALLGAALAQLCVLALAAPLPSGFERQDAGAPATRVDLARYAAVTLAAAAAWFGMMVLMAGAPLVMASCGLGLNAAAGAVSWHLLAMYLPAAVVGALGLRPAPAAGVAGGLCLLALAAAALPAQTEAAGFDLALIVGGVGWSLATLSATQWLHRAGASRALLALHDCALFCGAVLGALAAARLA